MVANRESSFDLFLVYKVRRNYPEIFEFEFFSPVVASRNVFTLNSTRGVEIYSSIFPIYNSLQQLLSLKSETTLNSERYLQQARNYPRWNAPLLGSS